MLKSALDRLALEPRLRDIDFCVYGNDLREVRYMFLKGFRKFPQLRLFNQGKLLLELESLKLGGDGELEEDFASLLISCFFPALSS